MCVHKHITRHAQHNTHSISNHTQPTHLIIYTQAQQQQNEAQLPHLSSTCEREDLRRSSRLVSLSPSKSIASL